VNQAGFYYGVIMKKDPRTLLEIPTPNSNEFIKDQLNGFFNGYRYTMCLKTAIELNLFDQTKERTHITMLSKEGHLDLERLEYLCLCLCQMELMVKDGDSYQNTPVSDLYLSSSSPYNQRHNILHILERMKKLDNLKESIENGGLEPRGSMFTHDWINAIGESAIGGNIALAINSIEEYIDLTRSSSLLDLGGGHGLYAIGFKYKYPNLRCRVFDQSSIIGATRKNIMEYGVDVETQEGDFYVDEIEGTYDLIFSSFNRSGSDPIMASAVADHLNKDGYLIIRRFANRHDTNPLRNMEWSLYRNLNSDNSKSLDDLNCEYVTILEKRNFTQIAKKDIDEYSEMIIMKKND
jgi:hypothetical protein